MYLQDYLPGQTVRVWWSSYAAAGASLGPATPGTISIYKGAGTSPSTTGITDVRNFNGITGIHLASIDLSNVFYAAYEDYAVVLSGAVLDGQSVDGMLAQFSIMNRSHSRLMVAGTVDSSGFTPTTAAFECSDISTEAASNNLAGRSVIGSLGNALIKQAAVIDTSSVVAGKGHFTVPTGALLSAPFANGSRIVIV